MRKILLLVAAITLTLSQLSGQEPTFFKGDKVLNLGIGFGTTLYTGSHYKSSLPPLSASLEFGVADGVIEKGVIGVGPYAAYSSYKYEYMDWGWKYTNFILGVRGNFHYPLLDKLDTYTGLLVGYNISSSKWTGIGDETDRASSGGPVWAWFIGARYYFRESFAVMAELGYGVTYFNLGVALKL
jgi:hypothetical protein